MRITSADILRAETQYNEAVCAEISAKINGDFVNWQKAVQDQARLRDHIQWLRAKMETENANTSAAASGHSEDDRMPHR